MEGPVPAFRRDADLFACVRSIEGGLAHPFLARFIRGGALPGPSSALAAAIFQASQHTFLPGAEIFGNVFPCLSLFCDCVSRN